MAEATTANPVNLYQLGQELGGNVGFRMVGPDPDGVCTIRADGVTEKALTAAVEAHKADPDMKPPDSPPPLDDVAALTKVLIAKGVITEADVDGAKDGEATVDASPTRTAAKPTR